ncbi:MAG TPA: hypothetical protein VEX38_10615, partial [Fimbriimonadaceae bacterium]|nr:hypothetical protein [Fimbriimonadaceae bacterium]
MLASLALLLSFQTVPQTAGRYDFFERLKLVDVAWMATQDAKRRKAATEHLIPATASFFRLQFADAAKELDLAAAALEARKPRASDAVSIKLESPFVEPGKPARVRVSWAYSPNPKGAAVVGAGSKTVRIRPGETSTLEVNPHVLNPDLRLTPEIGYLMPVRVGPSIRHLYVSLVKNAPARADMLTRSSHPHVKSMGEMLSRVIRRPETLEV